MTAVSLCDRLRAAHAMVASVRRVYALIQLHEMVSATTATTVDAVLNWSSLGLLLGDCARSLDSSDPVRAEWFRGLSSDAHRLSSAMRRSIESRRPGGGVPSAQRAPRGWVPNRVIDLAAVAS